ncbi:hypothetical protein [Geothrix sp. PMB-07]|uniref:hypothetical protein n=1 Tax=Geothrix sp. PMB-07 TaxID=3068640 RepID=UPI00274082C4|nr:hypothetical protein [Geothrix sp. PMB-07]WLT32313.1 hypothetical protein Q9293_03060 [Geothrix sp. PMB-07]
MRIAILGNSGSGKSTLARGFAQCHHLEAVDLDTFAWEPGKIAVPRDPAVALAEVAAFCQRQSQWVIEGCYANLIEATLPHHPLLVFLDPGPEVCRAHCLNRPWEPHKYASKAEQDEKLTYLLGWVEAYYTRDGDMSHRAHRALFDAYAGPKRRFTEPVESGMLAILGG